MSTYALLFDQSRCIGCGACEQACQSEHDQPAHKPDKLDHQSFTWVEDLGNDQYARHMCMSCEHPTCVSVCPVAALEKKPEGPVVWDGGRCMGCRYCMMACPFGVPTYEWESANPRIRKCDMCVHRVTEGLPTACASICPTGATTWGPREMMLKEARRRLNAHPDTYVDGIYGEKEAGGTSVLMLLSKPAKDSGLPDNVPEQDMPHLTWQVLEKLPQIIPVWGTFLGGMYWLGNRKDAVAKAERENGGDHHE
ncbi:4Fe-4S dicluster domain-containing protein [bacterium]|nr:4Fe-4S dicluster domain-containing protein [bacterium]